MNNNNNENKPSVMNIDLPQEVAKGKYSNLILTSFSPSEFVLDFALLMPGFEKPSVLERIILAPEHAKRLTKILNENIRRYEATHGIIPIDDNNNNFPGGYTAPGGNA